MLQAAMFQLRSAVETIEDPFIKSQVSLAAGVLGNAIDGAANGVNAAVVNEIAFALNDVAAAALDAPVIEPAVAMLQKDVDALKAATALPDDVIAGIRGLQSKLKVRKNAIERQTYVENASEPLPFSPEELRAEALALRDRLTSAGFATPALDMLIERPADIRFHSINDIVDELDVIMAS